MKARTGELEKPAVPLAQLFVRRLHFCNGVHENFQRTTINWALAIDSWLRRSTLRIYCTLCTVYCTLIIACQRRAMARLYGNLFIIIMDRRRSVLRLYGILYPDYCTLFITGHGLS